MSANKYAAYEKVQNSALSLREAEARLFAKAARLLDQAAENPGDREARTKALRFNHMLWTVIQADLSAPDSKLSHKLKADIMSLSIFVDKQTVKALADPKADNIKSLQNIDRNVAMGLFSRA